MSRILCRRIFEGSRFGACGGKANPVKTHFRSLAVFVLGALAAAGCEDPGSVGTTAEKPPGGGGPREIAYSVSTSNQGYCLRTMAVDGSNVGTISCPGGGVFFSSISWEPAGTAIAYLGLTEPNYGVYRVNVNGTNIQHLLPRGTYSTFGSLGWSPLGGEIAVTGVAVPDDDPVLLLLPAGGCPWPGSSDPCPRVLYTEPGGADHAFSGLAWSPDGTEIALQSSRGPGNGFLVLVEHATGAATDVRAWNGSVGDWGRGSRSTTLVLSQFTGSGTQQNLFLFDLATPTVAPILVVAGGRHPDFSPDGEFIVYQETSGQGPLVKRELDTNVRTLLARGGGLHPSWRKP